MSKGIYKKLSQIQKKLKAPKNQRNTFANYNFRNCEDILEAVKPLSFENGCTIILTDSIEMIGDRFYIRAEATIIDTEDESSITVSAYAREALNKKGMDDSQLTGASSSYARKYALNGLFCIDDTKDADSDNNENKKTKTVTKTINNETVQQKSSTNEPTDKQRKAIWAIANQIWPADTQKRLKEFCAGMGIPESSKDMSRKNATDLIESLKGLQ